MLIPFILATILTTPVKPEPPKPMAPPYSLIEPIQPLTDVAPEPVAPMEIKEEPVTAPQSVYLSQVPSTVSDNLYDFHSCTWWVKYNRPNVPNSWGDAGSWLGNAQGQGYNTGSTPQAGAVGWRPGHVVYVIAVTPDSITIGDGNYDYNGSYRVREALPSEFTYIY